MMKVLLVLTAVICATLASHSNLEDNWKVFKVVYNKNYNGEEEHRRRHIWETNVNHIEKHNRLHDMKLKSYRLAINQFSDLTNLEFRKYYNGLSSSSAKQSDNVFTRTDKSLPDTVDWRDKEVVTPVKNQEQCGSCWAFSTTGSVEAAHALKTGKLVSLSEQNLVDCSRNHGCSGGRVEKAFQYIIDNKGIDEESCYPYEAVGKDCRFKSSCIGATISSYKDVATGDEEALKEAVATVGPVSVAIDASCVNFESYSQGIYDEANCSTTSLDHAVLAIGYGTENGQDYWLVKNSWDVTWGMKGYIKMSRNKSNQCGIATRASYPII